jgi:hypothetical protein
MTYYEYNIVSGTASISLHGSSVIDELRLYPANSRMHSATYDPLIGKTSACDENNRIVYYTYDNLGRLQFTKDESGNIVKMYEYNNISTAKLTGCPATFNNNLVSETFTRSNCAAGYQGGTATYSVAASTYSSTISQLDADLQAELNILTNGQNYANTNGSCSLIYYNAVQSQTNTTQDCPAGQVGGSVTYTVPAATYSSIISQADADQQALNDIAANAPAYTTANPVCTVNTTADWEWAAGDDVNAADPSYCQSVSGQLPPHLFILVKDVNPNSATYNQTQYVDYGPNSACPVANYYNTVHSQTFTRNNCGTGFAGSSVTYTVPPGKYSSTTSQAAADLLATNDITANGQTYANTNGTCTSTLVTVVLVNSDGSSGSGYRAIFSGASGATYTFPASGSTTPTTTLPTGTYSIGFAPPPGNPGSNHNYTVAQGPNSHSASGTSASFTGIVVTAGTLTLTIH